MFDKFLDFEEKFPFADVSSQISSGDETILKELIDDISNYDVYDFIARVSTLNLLIENQNKSIVFDALIAGLLLRDSLSYTGVAKMSSGKFRKIITKLTELSLYQMIDPAENAFIERVRYYGNFWIFPGINFSPSFCIQGFLDYLCLQDTGYDTNFIHKAHRLINFTLQISNWAAQKLNYDEHVLKHVETNSINIPSSSHSDILKNCVVLDIELINELIPSPSLQDLLFSTFEEGPISSVLEGNWQNFYCHPFIKAPNNTVILLNPAILIPFVIHQIIVLAEEYGIKEQLIEGYNETIWNQCKKDIKYLGHKKIDEKAYGIELINNSSFREELLMVGNDTLLFLYFICDPGTNYNINSMFDTIELRENIPCIKDRNNYFLSNLPNSSLNNSYYVILINGFGRTVSSYFDGLNLQRTLTLTPFELHCISVNEHERPDFIPKYLNAKSQINIALPPMCCSELNTLEIYTKNDYSFYISDEFNPKTTNLYIGPGDSLDYVIRAFFNEKRHLINHYDDIHLADVIVNDPLRNIYFTHRQGNKPPELVIKFNNVVIWVSAEMPTCMDEAHVNGTLIDLISYWLAECKTIINKMQFTKESICIKICLKDSPQEYFEPKEDLLDFLKGISYKIASNIITMEWDSNSFRHLGTETNEIEKTLVASLLSEIQKFSRIPANIAVLNEIFLNPLKKKVFEIDTVNTPYAIPTTSELQIVSTEEENQLLNEIGTHFLEKHEYSYGKVPDEKRSHLANSVVSYLYALLQSEVSSINPTGVYERVCFDLETVMYNIMTCQKRYAYDVSCYPEKTESINKQYNEANKSSVALKFFAEYIAAVPPKGQNPLGELQYNRILAICHLIVEWGYRNDSFVHNIVNTPIEFLKSGRIGMPREDDEYLANINSFSRVRRLESLSNPAISVFSPVNMLNDYEKELDEAFDDEYGFSFQEFIKGVLAICLYDGDIAHEVKRVPRMTLIQEVAKSSGINETTINNIIDQITLTAREDFLKPPKPFEAYDVYPWRFNRELSFTRRPIIQHNDDLIWGNRQLQHMWRYVFDLIIEGKYKARKEKLTQLIGKISNKRGNDFNSAVYQKLSEIPELIVQKNVTKINGKKIASEAGNVLGDIDVLYVIPKRHKIIVGEVKDFSFAKNPYEMDREYKKIFVDGKKPCFITKHKRRISWVEEHLDDVIKHFNLPEGRWSVHSAMFVSEEIVSNLFYHKNETIITYSDITKSTIFSI